MPETSPEQFNPDIADLTTEAALNEWVLNQPMAPKPSSLGGPGPAPEKKLQAPTLEVPPASLGLIDDYTSPLGLSPHDRAVARLRASYAAMVGVARRGVTTYTEGGLRWDGINNHRNPWGHPRQSPHYADCSAFVTWAIWVATRDWHLHDFVNGQSWQAGYTGTMTEHGVGINGGSLIHADVVMYGGSWWVPQHTAIYVGNGRVVSHGQQGDPQVYPVDLYGALPITRFIRYIR